MLPDETSTPTSPSPDGGVSNSPQRRQQNLWASVVRGQDSDRSSPRSSPPPTDFVVDVSGNDTVQPDLTSATSAEASNGFRMPIAWNRASSNGSSAGGGGVVVESNVSAPVVMGGAVSWPALSESTRPGARSWTETRPVGDGSLVSSSPQAPIISQPPQRPANTNSHHHTHSAANSTVPNRPRRNNRGANPNPTPNANANANNAHSGSGPSQNSFNRPAAPMPPPFPVFEPAAYGMVPPPMQEAPARGPRPVGGMGPHSGNEHSSPRSNNPRRGNFGPRPRGDGHYHNNHGGRRDQDRRDVHVAPQYGPPPPMGYMAPPMPHGTGPFMPPVRMYPAQMGFEMSPFIYVQPFSTEPFRGMPPIVPQPAPMIVSPVNENLMTRIIKQIDYYFSEENLIKDNYLKSHMDEYGWVPVSLLANFPRVQLLTKDINEILEALRYSTIVEIQGDKVRRRDDWNRFLLSSGSNNEVSGSGTSSAATENVLASSMQHVSLNDSTANTNGIAGASQGHSDMATGKVLPEGTLNHSRLTNGEDTSGESH